MYENFNVMVIGDYGLDVWRVGKAERLSPEAPVPVISNPSLHKSPGLAGNVTANLASLGANVLCFGVMGKGHVEAMDVYTDFGLTRALMTLAVDEERLTTTKERIISDGHQIARIDVENTHDIDAATEDIIINQVEAGIAQTNCIVVSDYGKGVCTGRLIGRVMDIAEHCDVPVFVDPKDNLLIYDGATILKPNSAEWQACVDAHVDTEIQAKFVVVTRGAEGMDIMLESHEDGMMYKDRIFPGYEVPVHDRTGAGDTAMAVMALEYLRSNDIVKAVELANFAGALAVQHFGTYRATVEDLMDI